MFGETHEDTFGMLGIEWPGSPTTKESVPEHGADGDKTGGPNDCGVGCESRSLGADGLDTCGEWDDEWKSEEDEDGDWGGDNVFCWNEWWHSAGLDKMI